MEGIITYILLGIALYSIIGVVFSLVFMREGLIKTDPSVKGSGVLFKFFIFPGLIIFWPLFMRKWIKINKA